MHILVKLGLVAGLALTVQQAAAKDLTFGYAGSSMAYPYVAATAAGFQEAAKAAGVKTVVLDPKGQVDAQANAIDDLIAQGVDAIGFMPIDSVVSKAFVDKANSAGIPIVAIAVQVGDPQTRALKDVYRGLSALVIPDDVVNGSQAAKLAISVLPKDRPVKIAIIEGAPGYSAVAQRKQGFIDGLNASGIKYQIVASQPTDWTPEKGEAVCQNILVANPDIDLIFSEADDMAIGCARAIAAANSKAKLIATSGGSKLGEDAIASGDLLGSTCVRPKTMGKMMFKAMYEAATNPNTPKARYETIDLPIITKDNLNICPPEW